MSDVEVIEWARSVLDKSESRGLLRMLDSTTIHDMDFARDTQLHLTGDFVEDKHKRDYLEVICLARNTFAALLEVVLAEVNDFGADARPEVRDAIEVIRDQMPRPPYPQFCHHPDRCAAARRCLRDPVCSE